MRKTINKNRINQHIFLIGIFVSCLSISSCDYLAMPEEPDYTNRFDTINPDFIWPVAIITSPSSDEITLNADNIDIQISTSYENSTISYQLIGLNEEWQTSESTQLTFDYLNEGDYELRIREVTSFGISQKDYTDFNFTIDAITGPALVLASKKVVHSSSIQLAVIAEEVTDLKATQVKIVYNSSLLSFDGAFEGDFLASDGDGQFFDATASGDTITISSARLGSGGVNGTGVLAEMSFSSITETETTIDIINSSIMRDSNNDAIRVTYFGETIVVSN